MKRLASIALAAMVLAGCQDATQPSEADSRQPMFQPGPPANVEPAARRVIVQGFLTNTSRFKQFAVTCPPGYMVVNGGYKAVVGLGATIIGSHPFQDPTVNGWEATAEITNTSGTSWTFAVYAIASGRSQASDGVRGLGFPGHTTASIATVGAVCYPNAASLPL